MRIVFRLSCFVTALCLTCFMFVGWTESGLNLLTRSVSSLSDGAVTFGKAEGALFLSFSVENTRIASDAVDVQVGRVASTWNFVELFNKQLHVEHLIVSAIHIQLKEYEEDDGANSDDPIVMPDFMLPVAVALDTVEVKDFKLVDTDLSELTRIDSLSFTFSGNDSFFQLSNVSLDAPGYEAILEGSVDTEKNWHIELAGEVVYRDYGTGPFAGHVSFSGPLSRLDTEVELHTPARAHVEGQITELPNNFSWHADLAMYDVHLADTYEDMPVMKFTVTGTAEGEMATYGGRLKGTLDYLFLENVSFDGELWGNEDQIEFREVTAENGYGKAHLFEGLLSWKDDLVWSGHLEVEDLNPELFSVDYPGVIDAELLSSGSYNDESELILDVDLKQFSGTLGGYELIGHGRAFVDEKSLSLDDLLIQSGKAVLKASASAESEVSLAKWQESLSWEGSIAISEFDPALFFPDYPGVVNTEIKSEGESRSGRIDGVTEIATLHGELRGYPISGAGTVRMNDMVATVENLFLQSGTSVVNIEGHIGDSFDISTEIVSKNIGEFVEGAQGSVKVSGTVTGELGAPAIDTQISVKGLSYQESRLDSLQVSYSGGIDTESIVHVIMKGQGIHMESIDLTGFDLSVDGLISKHDFSAAIMLPDAKLKFSGQGGLQEDDSWSADIQNLQGSHPLVGKWQQNGVASIEASAVYSSLESLCLEAGKEIICAGGQWSQEESTWGGELRVEHISLGRLNDLLEFPEPLSGSLSATLAATGDLKQIFSAHGQAEVVDVSLGEQGEDSEWEALQCDKANLDFSLEHQLLNTHLVTELDRKSTLNVELEIPDVGTFDTDPATLELNGTIDANIKNITFIAPLTDYFIRPSGTVKGKVAITGTLFQPTATGILTLVDGQLEIPGLGITVEDVQLGLAGSNDGIDIDGSATSGPGTMNASGNIRFTEQGVLGAFRFTGENVDVAVLPEYEIRATPDLQLDFSAKGGGLNGEVFIPYALIAPDRMIGVQGLSEDVLYVDEVEEEKDSGWELAMRVKVKLGDDVKLEGYGLSGYLRGDLLVEQQPGLHMTGKGEISLVDGLFSLYGRTLDIERSRVMFAGGTIDNPGVDVRANKIVEDKARRNSTIEVGVDISGTVNDLEFSLYSDPVLEESDILAYMVIGRSQSDAGQKDESALNSAAMMLGVQGVGGLFDEMSEILLMDEMYIEGGMAEDMSLVVGKNLTKDLFIGYGHNFFNQEGEVRIRYDLGSGFSVESRSSGEATGADLLYSFER